MGDPLGRCRRARRGVGLTGRGLVGAGGPDDDATARSNLRSPPHHQGRATATKIQQIPLLPIDGEEASLGERLRSFGVAANDEPDILWNFEKFLVARDRTVVRRFAPSMTPDDPVILTAVDDELAR
jgi:hypothetical protein